MLYVKDLITKEVVLSGRSRGGLYIMYESSATLLPQAFLFACLSTCIDIWHWHCWLGHLNLRILSFLVSNKKISCTSKQFHFNCQACSLGKSLRLSLGPMGHKTSTPLELIFSDIWGPSPMLSSDDFWYFVIFVDVHTKYILFFFLWLQNLMFSIFSPISNSSWMSVLVKN
jgi:histone deacetylase 1/2